MTKAEAKKILKKAGFCLIHLRRKFLVGNNETTKVCIECYRNNEAKKQRNIETALKVMKTT